MAILNDVTWPIKYLTKWWTIKKLLYRDWNVTEIGSEWSNYMCTNNPAMAQTMTWRRTDQFCWIVTYLVPGFYTNMLTKTIGILFNHVNCSNKIIRLLFEKNSFARRLVELFCFSAISFNLYVSSMNWNSFKHNVSRTFKPLPIRNNADFLSIGPLLRNFSEIWIKLQQFSNRGIFENVVCKTLSRPQCVKILPLSSSCNVIYIL